MTDISPTNIDLPVLLRKLIGVVDAFDDEITLAHAIRAGVRGLDGNKDEQNGLHELLTKLINQLVGLRGWVDELRLGEDEPPADGGNGSNTEQDSPEPREPWTPEESAASYRR
jgi:hypothetical protein